MRSVGVWITAAIVILIVVIAMMVLTTDDEVDEPLHFDSTSRSGTKALVETLRAHGVEVTTTEDKKTARTAAARPDTTLLIPANTDALSAGDINGFEFALRKHANRLALVDPGANVASFTDRITVNDNGSPLEHPGPGVTTGLFGPECPCRRHRDHRCDGIRRNGEGHRRQSPRATRSRARV